METNISPGRPWPDPSEKSQRKRILIVEDDSDIQCLMRFFVQSAGHEVEIAATGETVIEQIPQRNAPHLVLLDRMLPGRCGSEVLACIRRSEQWSHVPVLIVSALSDVEEIDALLASGATGYLTKPFVPVNMIRRINQLLPT